ncbi:glycosyltransferase family 4 protein [Bradyrhizobium sp. WSM 1738]|uniref:glycosyltransferase family 4 protein n=1 Tax=Bradyrhizobium hereditatis TaxID=2821405 RepID=UPI001CE25EB4|nr:glycosyltransferase family 4 protein [Bradyrhizobium hereditatis]MCA6117783.1 glycosyltransferase family 4 protein [Bradyrhizobium hereditatis]
METSSKLVIATQFYPPDKSTTAVYLGKIAEGLAAETNVTVLAATPNSASRRAGAASNPTVIEIGNWNPKKTALIQRSIAVCALAVRMFFSVLRRARSKDVVFCVTTPFTLPYGVVLAAKLRRARTLLLIYDLYPEALEAAGFVKPASIAARLLRFANGLLFRCLDSIVVIGRDVPPLLARYKGVAPDKIQLIPNWVLLPIGYRQIDPRNRFRAQLNSKFVVGLSGNLGFTHAPATVFEAAKLLKLERDIHFLLSGWGVGWKELNDLATREMLDNVTILPPVPQEELVEFLSAADVWVIPYRRNIAGVSIPSRLYNLLAVGRPVIVAAEAHSEAAIELSEEAIGWVVPPEEPPQLAHTIREAARDRSATEQKGRRAAVVAEKYGEEAALMRYRALVNALKERGGVHS